MSFFQYCTVEDIRKENVSSSNKSDERILEFIEVASRFINQETEQFFVPVREQHVVNGDGTDTIRPVARIPIQELKNINITNIPAGVTLTKNDFTVPRKRSDDRRKAKLTVNQGPGSTFPEGNNNVEIDAVFGWLEPRFSSPLTRQVSTDANWDATEVELNDSERISSHLIPVIGEETLPPISSVDGNTIKFDQEINFPVQSGDEVVFYGATPKPIRRVCIQIVIQSFGELSSGEMTEFTETPQFQSRVVSERTDNYRYQLAQDIPEGQLKQGSITSDIYNILRQYTVDPHFRMGAV